MKLKDYSVDNEFDKYFTFKYTPKFNVMDIFNNEDSVIIKSIQVLYNISREEKKLGYGIIFNYNHNSYILIEQQLSKTLYYDYNISFEPWIKFKSHIIVPLADFMDISVEVIKDIYNDNRE